jgi:hypothetical protein
MHVTNMNLSRSELNMFEVIAVVTGHHVDEVRKVAQTFWLNNTINNNFMPIVRQILSDFGFRCVYRDDLLMSEPRWNSHGGPFTPAHTKLRQELLTFEEIKKLVAKESSKRFIGEAMIESEYPRSFLIGVKNGKVFPVRKNMSVLEMFEVVEDPRLINFHL